MDGCLLHRPQWTSGSPISGSLHPRAHRHVATATNTRTIIVLDLFSLFSAPSQTPLHNPHHLYLVLQSTCHGHHAFRTRSRRCAKESIFFLFFDFVSVFILCFRGKATMMVVMGAVVILQLNYFDDLQF